MKQEEKQLLIKDLCGRLPYEIKFEYNKNVYTAKGLDLIVTDEGYWDYAVTAKGVAPIEIDFIKPYLFHLSSMTEEQKEEFYKLFEEGITEYKNETKQWLKTKKASKTKRPITIAYVMVHELVVDWLNKNNFDYRGLIEKGLALDATNLGIY